MTRTTTYSSERKVFKIIKKVALLYCDKSENTPCLKVLVESQEFIVLSINLCLIKIQFH